MATLSNFFLHYQTKAGFTVDKEAGKSQYLYIKAVRDICELYFYEFIDNSYLLNIKSAEILRN